MYCGIGPRKSIGQLLTADYSKLKYVILDANPWLRFQPKTATRVLPVTPVSPCDPPGFHLIYIPEGDLVFKE